jgi:hypothetical protein
MPCQPAELKGDTMIPHSNAFIRGQKFDTHQYTLTESEQRLRVLELSVGLLIARTKIGEFWAEGFSDVTQFLEAVPLATPEFDAAKRHLQNAFDYCELNEFGAAAFELRILRGILQRL